jgi:hypothetical protein
VTVDSRERELLAQFLCVRPAARNVYGYQELSGTRIAREPPALIPLTSFAADAVGGKHLARGAFPSVFPLGSVPAAQRGAPTIKSTPFQAAGNASVAAAPVASARQMPEEKRCRPYDVRHHASCKSAMTSTST